MNSSFTRWWGCLAVCGSLMCMTAGCGSSNSTRSFGDSGPPPSARTLAKVKAGQTSREWVVTALGEPKRASDEADGKELLTYEYAENVESKVNAPFLNANETTKTLHSLHFEIKNDVVQRFWQEKRVQEKRSTLN